MSIDQVWIKYKKTSDKELKNKLIKAGKFYFLYRLMDLIKPGV